MLSRSFSQNCYALLKQVPKGKVTTYKALAEALGTKAYRAVGTAMNKNPNAPRVPCHRVVNTNSSVGNYALGAAKKIALLKEEGVEMNNKRIDLEKFGYTFI